MYSDHPYRPRRGPQPRPLLATLAVTLLLLSAPGLVAQTSGLQLTLDTGGTSFVLGEPVHAALTLTNTGSQPVTVLPNLYPEVGFAGVDVAFAGGEARRYAPLAVDDVEDAPLPLAPGAIVTAVFPIFYGAAGWTFDAPGEYRLTAIYDPPGEGFGGPVRSEPVTITIQPDPSGAAAALMAGDERRDEAALFLTWEGGDHLRRGIARLESVIEQYPDSAAADHARLALGVSLSQPFRDYSVGKVREPVYDRALAYLNAVEPTRFRGYAALQRSLSEARCLVGLERADEARGAAQRAMEIAADQPALMERVSVATSESAALRAIVPQ